MNKCILPDPFRPCAKSQTSLLTLDDIVKDYMSKHSCVIDTNLQPLVSIGDCVVGRHNDKYTTIARLRRDGHQYDVDTTKIIKLIKLCDRLFTPYKTGRFRLKRVRGIDDFEALFEFAATEAINNGIIQSKGALILYDTCFRLGHFMTPVIEPDVYVYLHRDLGQSAAHLFDLFGWPTGWDRTRLNRCYRIPKCFIPAPLNALESKYVENILCIYRKQILSLV